jgi:acyl-CoA reductase-like NAD-dependent aldehyde dehydrogenase
MSLPERQQMALACAAKLDAGRSLKAPHDRTFVVNQPTASSCRSYHSPVLLAFTQIVAALLAGNCVVLKPRETCPLALIRLVIMFAEALPPGMKIVMGLPAEIGDVLTTHPDVGKIGFTRSIPSARHIMANAAQTIKGVTLELGGNDPAIVLDDADLGASTIKSMLGATFQMHCGSTRARVAAGSGP